MISQFRMPSLGADMEAGKLVQWLKRPGDRVQRGDIVAVVETQKGAIEVEIFVNGVIEGLLVEPGAKVPVGTPLATILEAEAEAEAGAVSAEPPPAVGRTEAVETPPLGPPQAVAAGVVASPAARRLAVEKGIDLARVAGTGPGGAIIAADVEKALSPPSSAPQLDLAVMRQAMGAAMARSKREIPHYYLSETIDIGRAREWVTRANLDRPPSERLLLSVLLVKATAVALGKVPEMNGFYLDGRFQPSAERHVGFAVAIRGGGLIAPALHSADRCSLEELMIRLRDVTTRARAGRLRSSELAEPTITVTCLGEHGAEVAFPIIYPPQVAIVGFGRESLRPWVFEGSLTVRPVLTASLGADHRVSDGHRGSLLLAEVGRLLQRPEAL